MHPILRSGYWISPCKKVFMISSHIDAVCGHPHSFGTSERTLEALFQHYHEPVGCEGLARVVVVKALVKQANWIRARNYFGEWWSLNMRGFSVKSCAVVTHFFRELYPDSDSYEEVVLDTFEGRRKISVSDIRRFGLFAKGKPRNFGSYRLTFVEGPEEIPAVEVRPIKLVPLPDDQLFF